MGFLLRHDIVRQKDRDIGTQAELQDLPERGGGLRSRDHVELEKQDLRGRA